MEQVKEWRGVLFDRQMARSFAAVHFMLECAFQHNEKKVMQRKAV